MTGITRSEIKVTRPDGSVVPADKITDVRVTSDELTVDLDSDQFARITSVGTTIATRAFGRHSASSPVPVRSPGEPAANGHILGSSKWTDNG